MSSTIVLVLLHLVFAHYIHVQGNDADPFHDFCVADLHNKVHVNGYLCKDPDTVVTDDFFFDGLVKPGNTSNYLASAVTTAFVKDFPGLYTLGVSMARLDFAPWGINPPHTHPRASEILIVIEGSLLVGFVTSNPENQYFSRELQKGEVFVFPRGTLHFQQNMGHEPALAILALSSSGPGRADIAEVTFAATPRIPDFLLAKTFDTKKELVHEIRDKIKAVKQQRLVGG